MPTAKTVDVPVIKAFTHDDGRRYRPGDRVTVAPVHALALARRGLVSLSPTYQTRHLEPEPLPPLRTRRSRKTAAKTPRTYRTRALRADPVIE